MLELLLGAWAAHVPGPAETEILTAHASLMMLLSREHI